MVEANLETPLPKEPPHLPPEISPSGFALSPSWPASPSPALEAVETQVSGRENPKTILYVGERQYIPELLQQKACVVTAWSNRTLVSRDFHVAHERLWKNPVDHMLIEPRGVTTGAGSRTDRKSANSISKLVSLQLQKSREVAVLAPRSSEFWNLTDVQQTRRDPRLHQAEISACRLLPSSLTSKPIQGRLRVLSTLEFPDQMCQCKLGTEHQSMKEESDLDVYHTAQQNISESILHLLGIVKRQCETEAELENTRGVTVVPLTNRKFKCCSCLKNISGTHCLICDWCGHTTCKIHTVERHTPYVGIHRACSHCSHHLGMANSNEPLIFPTEARVRARAREKELTDEEKAIKKKKPTKFKSDVHHDDCGDDLSGLGSGWIAFSDDSDSESEEDDE